MSTKIHFAADNREVHVDVPLSNVAIDYRPQGMIADMIAPIVEVTKHSDVIPVFNRNWRNEDSARAPGTEANKVTREVGSDTYFCKNYALKTNVTAEQLTAADPIYKQKLYNNAAEFLSGKLILGWDKRVSDQVMNTSNVGSSAAVSSAWTDYANSDPLADIQTAMDNVYDATGYTVNKITIGESAWRNLRRNDIVTNKINGNNNGGGYATLQEIANLLDDGQGVEVLIGKSFIDTAAEGQSENLERVWGDDMLFHYAPSAPSTNEPSFMYSFRQIVAGVPSFQAERHGWDKKIKAEETEVGYYQDEKIIDATLSFLLTAVNSST